MPFDVKELELPKITGRSDIKEVRLVKTDGTSVSMEISTFIKEIALEIARTEGFASVVAELMGVKGLNYLSTWIEVTSSNSFSYNLKGTIAIISVLQEYSGMSFSVVIDMDSVVTLHDDNIYGLSYSLTGTTFKLSASSGIHGLRFRILELQS